MSKIINKSIIRDKMLHQCKSFDTLYYTNCATAIAENINGLIADLNNIAIYYARSWEADLSAVIKSAQMAQKKLYYPVAYKEQSIMQFAECQIDFSMPSPLLYGGVRIDPQLFVEAGYQPEHTIEWYHLDLIFLPLVAVDKIGTRLGSGGGYHDSTLAKLLLPVTLKKKPILCGVGFSCQMVDVLPRDSWDIPLDYFVSELGLHKFYKVQ